MLPYTLRPPCYGGKLKKPIDSQHAAIPFEQGGGPLQRAIYEDLLLLQASFHKTVDANAQHPAHCHEKTGAMFAIFKSVFGNAKAALLHTQLSPQRCDRSQYSQLLYAACLQIVSESYASTSMIKCSFAVFALYALYETNPLPLAPSPDELTNETEILDMLPMSVQNRENPKLVYRRNFKGSIRIDATHYAYLIQARERCLEEQADCEAAKLSTSQQSSWTCNCSLVRDLGVVLERLIPNLELCSYTGPRGLEGLAGHSDYPYRATEQDVILQSVWNDADDTVDPSRSLRGDATLPFSFSSDFECQLKDYIKRRGTIRLPPDSKAASMRSKRVRNAILPVFQTDDDDTDIISQIISASLRGEVLQTGKRIQLRQVTFNDVVQVGDSSVSVDHIGATGKSKNGDMMEENQKDFAHTVLEEASELNLQMSYNLALPDGLSEAQEQSLQNVVETLNARNQLLFTSPAASLKPADIGGERDDISTLGGGSLSVKTMTSNSGRKALDVLLTQANAQLRQYNIQELGPHNFLGDLEEDSDNEVAEPTKAPFTGNFSDLSSDDELSIAASAVGQRALESLLAKSCKPAKKSSKRDGSVKPVAAEKTRKRARTTKRRKGTSGDEDENVSRYSISSDRGRGALQKLLDMAKNNK
jgi:hypothetical protein